MKPKKRYQIRTTKLKNKTEIDTKTEKDTKNETGNEITNQNNETKNETDATNDDANKQLVISCEMDAMEDVSVDLKDINASKTVALSDLHRPPQKCQKINHLTPMTIVLIKTQLEKSRFKKNKI